MPISAQNDTAASLQSPPQRAGCDWAYARRVTYSESSPPPRREPAHPSTIASTEANESWKPISAVEPGSARQITIAASARLASNARARSATQPACTRAPSPAPARSRRAASQSQLGARRERRGKRRRLVGVAARRQRREKHHQQPHEGERGGRDESQVKPGDTSMWASPVSANADAEARRYRRGRRYSARISARSAPPRSASIKAPIRARIAAI